MLTNLTEEELELIELLHYPVASIECLFSNLDNLSLFNDNFSHVRLYQYSLLSYEYLIDKDNNKTEKENFKLREGAGNTWCFGGRLFGKTAFVEKLDILLSFLLLNNDKAGFTSYDAIHIRGVLEDIIRAVEQHPILNEYRERVNRSPNYFISSKNGFTLESVNMNIQSKNPGSGFFQKHFTKLFVEEASLETDEVNKKRAESISELGCIAKGSKILLSDFTTKNIEDIEEGDEILSWDEKNKKITKAKVLKKIYQGKKDAIKIKSEIYNNEVWLTPDHRMLIITPHDRCYRWGEAGRAILTKYETKVIPFIDNLENYCKGLLLGIIEADGYIQEIKLKSNKVSYQISIAQKDEVEFIEYLLKRFNITFRKKTYVRTDTFSKNPITCFYIYRENNKFIFDIYNLIEKDKDVQYGFLVGFTIGDGYFDKRTGNLKLSQSIKKERQIKLIDDLINKLNFKNYNRTKTFKRIIRQGGQYGESEIVCWSFSKWNVPVFAPKCKKVSRYFENIFSEEKSRVYVNKDFIHIKGFKENVDMYDLTTTIGNFIANGFIVHNCVIRSSGMTNFTKYSPAGRIWNDLTKRPWLINYPQYVNPTFDEKARMNAIKKHHGENTVSFRVFVEGEVVEEGISVFDMERIRSNNYLENKKIKHFEINKNNLANHKDILILERPNNAEIVFICADIGETAPTKIIIVFKINNKYRYDYKITLYNLTDKEQEIIFDYLIQTLKANIISLDCGEGLGRVIYRYLEEKYGKEHLVYYDGSKKIKVDFERDENNNVVFKNGEPVYKEEFMSEWSIQRLKHLLYEELLFIPANDYEFDEQFNSVISMSSGNRIIYECLSESDHLFDTFKIFAIAQWDKEFSIIKPVKVKKFFKSGV